MRFKITGANAESGDDVDVVLEAATRTDVERIAHDKGILVSAIAPAPMHADAEAISLVEDEPPANGAAAAPHAAGVITVSANSPSETGHSGTGQIHQATNTGTTPVKLKVVFVAEKGKPLTTPVK